MVQKRVQILTPYYIIIKKKKKKTRVRLRERRAQRNAEKRERLRACSMPGMYRYDRKT